MDNPSIVERLRQIGTGPTKEAAVSEMVDCHRCARDLINAGANPLDFAAHRMFLCPECGNKRCPKASDHRLTCTGSNEPGQVGSVYQ